MDFLDPWLIYIMAPIPPLPQDDTIQRAALLALSYVIHASAYCFEPSGSRDAAYLAVLTGIFARIWSLNSPTFVSQAFIALNTVTFALRTYANFLIIHPEETRRRTSDPKSYNVTEDSNIFRRFKWGLSYLTNYRGIGWSHTVKGVQKLKGKEEYKTRSKFVLSCARSILFALAFQDIWNSYCATQPFWQETGQKEGFHSHAVNGTEINALWIAKGAAHSLAGFISSCLPLMILYDGAAALAVTAGISQPKDWPPLYGRLKDAYTVRRFWGRVYHQTFRDLFEPYTKGLATYFDLVSGSHLSKYSQLYTAFIISSGIHYLQYRNVPYPKGLPDQKMTPYPGTDQIAFFLLQAVIIHLEDLAISTWKKYRWQATTKRVTRHMSEKQPSTAYKVAGYTWVTVWLAATARFLLDEAVLGGAFEQLKAQRWSFVRWFLEGVNDGSINFKKVGSNKPDWTFKW